MNGDHTQGGNVANNEPDFTSVEHHAKMFQRFPTPVYAGRYLEALMVAEGNDAIGREQFFNGLTEIRDHLLGAKP
jgi:hypothetical protein